MSKFTSYRLNQIWDKGQTVRGKDLDLYRRDIYGNEMYKHSYGKNSKIRWEVDHSKPESKGGTDHLNNLQPMNPSANRSKSDKY